MIWKGFCMYQIAICNYERSSWQSRPNQAQVDLLSEMMGGKQPRWWIDYDDPRSCAFGALEYHMLNVKTYLSDPMYIYYIFLLAK